MLRTIGKLSLGVGVASYGSAVFYRPLPAPETQQQQVQPPTTASASSLPPPAVLSPFSDQSTPPPLASPLPPSSSPPPSSSSSSSSSKHRQVFASSRALVDFAGLKDPLPIQIASQISIFTTVCACRMFMMGGGKFKVIEDLNYKNFVKNVIQRDRGRGMITVSNHRSMCDDPPLIASILPFWLSVNPMRMRWGICAQEYCFNEKMPAFIKAFIGSGKILPIHRGGGINQKLLLDVTRKLANGDWVHVFPEAGVWQKDTLGGRGADDKVPPPKVNGKVNNKGKLKWGIGKMIAHAPKTPVVIPFCHLGMEKIMPQDTETRKNQSTFPIPFVHDVTVKFGEEVSFDDLIEEHEEQYGKIRKCNANCTDDEYPVDQFHLYWKSTPAEERLYHNITYRIEQKLEALHSNLIGCHNSEELKLDSQSSQSHQRQT